MMLKLPFKSLKQCLYTWSAMALGFAICGLLASQLASAESPHTLLVGSEIGFAPYADADSNGQATGFSVELFSAVARVMDIPIQYRVSDWNVAWNGLLTGNLAALPAVARLKERENLVEFTSTHTLGYDCFFERKGELHLSSIEHARGHKIIVMRSDAAHHVLVSRGFSSELVVAETLSEAMLLLASGNYDAVLAPLVQGSLILNQRGLTGLEAGPPLKEYRREFAFAVKKGDTKLRDQLEQGLLILKESGEYQRIYDHWLGIYATPHFPLKYIAWGSSVLIAVLLALGLWAWQERRRQSVITESNNRLLFALQANHLGGWEVNLASGAATSTAEHDHIFGFESAPLHWSYQMFLEQVLPEDRSRVDQLFKEAVAAKGYLDFECRIRRADGMERWLRVAGGHYRVGGKPKSDSMAGIVQDITKLKESDLALGKFKALVDYNDDAIITKTLSGVIESWNPAAELLFGYSAKEAIGHSLVLLIPPDRQKEEAEILARISRGERVSHFETVRRCKDGRLIDISASVSPIYDDRGKVILASKIARNISERKRLERELRESETNYKSLFEHMLNGFAYCRMLYDESGEAVDFVYIEVNKAFERLTGLVNVMGKAVSEVIPGHLEQSRDLIETYARVAATGTPEVFEYEVKQQGIYLLISVYSPQKQHFIAVFEDISARKQAEEKLTLASSVFTYAREGIIITETSGNIIDVNEAFTYITGYERFEVLGKNPSILSSGLQPREFYTTMWRDLLEKGHWYGELWNRRKSGELYAELLNISTLRDAQGNTRQYVGLFSDITAAKEHEKQLEHIAHYDALTRLPNRVLLADRLQQAMAQAQRRSKHLAVAYLDLDGFKAVNDTHGHEVGDQLLITVSSRMREVLREGDTISRVGGDEFVTVLIDLDNIEACEPTLIRLLSAAARPIKIGDLQLKVSASLGVTFYPQTEDIDADQLMRQADQAMYQAKIAGKNRFHVFDSELDRSIRVYHESVERIQCALRDREFVLYYQPKVNMRTGEIVGAEALIRWQHPQRGLLLPSLFLPVIEDHPLAVTLGEWVIDTALNQIEIWAAAGLSIPVSVNIGARQLQQSNFVEQLRNLLAAHPEVSPKDLEMEVLETSALQDLLRASEVVVECRSLGVLFALDDFGTGYSSLTYLKRLPVKWIKIDQSFVCDMLNDPDDLSILTGVLGLALAFRREVIAEGVETRQHGAMLLQLGCDIAQGYGIARPMPASEFPAWTKTWHNDPSWGNLPAIIHADLPLLFASAEHRAWVATIDCYLKGECGAPMTLDQHQCRFGIWLDAVTSARHERQPDLKALVPLHLQLHELAAQLCDLEKQGKNSEARAKLGELTDLRDALINRFAAFL